MIIKATETSLFWKDFIKKNPQYKNSKYESVQLGMNPSELLNKILMNKKKATSSLHKLYIMDQENIPEVGTISIVCDSNGNPGCIIENINVRIIQFDKILEKDAILEIDEPNALSKWKEIHKKFFEEECISVNLVFDEKDLIVFEEFKILQGSVV